MHTDCDTRPMHSLCTTLCLRPNLERLHSIQLWWMWYK
ncbi:hypothetical protein OESDEN_23045 [Oesophagostomum dentatum]|uniref:Uncharacterized protein n=1 Tax=Oesophagostomum dentatum TaxID=61180 RepID=A0A0B1S286_OESDE|nr:hypothetical protein OESDEN_23045 [Oesophagostomum dentatum]